MSIQSKSTAFETYLDVIMNKMIYFHYHQKCQDITDSTGDIELDLKWQRHVTVKKPVISIIYIVSHTWPLCSAQILVDGVNPR